MLLLAVNIIKGPDLTRGVRRGQKGTRGQRDTAAVVAHLHHIGALVEEADWEFLSKNGERKETGSEVDI